MNKYKQRLSFRRYKKMRNHLEELRGFFLESLGALENMIDTAIDEEKTRRRNGEHRSQT